MAKPAKKPSKPAKKPAAKKAAPAAKKTVAKPKSVSSSSSTSKKKSLRKAANDPIKKSIPVNETKPKSKTNSAPAMKLTANDNDVIANAKNHYGKKDLEFFKAEILKQRDEAKEEFDIISHQLLDTSGEYDAENQSFSLHTAEQGSDAMEREKQYLQAQRTSDFIKKLDEALERIDRGTYGICVICGELIEKQRLLAVPITQKHVLCKNKTQAKKFSASEPFASIEESVE